MSKYRNIINQCKSAIEKIESILTPKEFQECIDYITKYEEWLLGIELAIDWLIENDQKITSENYQEFEKAYKLMKVESDTRLQHLKIQIINIDK
ncbi:MAG: MafI family immunity protein [Pleurocapsa sp.]